MTEKKHRPETPSDMWFLIVDNIVPDLGPRKEHKSERPTRYKTFSFTRSATEKQHRPDLDTADL